MNTRLKSILVQEGLTTLQAAKAWLLTIVKSQKPASQRFLQQRTLMGLFGYIRGTEIMDAIQAIAAADTRFARLYTMLDDINYGVDMGLDETPVLIQTLTALMPLIPEGKRITFSEEEVQTLLDYRYNINPKWKVRGFRSMPSDSEISEVLA